MTTDELVPPLKDRFFTFLRAFPGAEEIDPLVTRKMAATNLKFADFLFEGRTIIAEVKTLETQTTAKLEEFMAKLGVHPATLPSGSHIVEDVFAGLPDGDKLYRKATDLVMRPVADGFDEADRQIRDTKRLFRISSADGLLIILNDSVSLASPPAVVERLQQRVRKSGPDGSPYHAHISHIFHVGELHAVNVEELRDKRINLSLAKRRVGDRHGVAALVDRLAEAWAAFCGHPFERAADDMGEFLRDSRLCVRVE